MNGRDTVVFVSWLDESLEDSEGEVDELIEHEVVEGVVVEVDDLDGVAEGGGGLAVEVEVLSWEG